MCKVRNGCIITTDRPAVNKKRLDAYEKIALHSANMKRIVKKPFERKTEILKAAAHLFRTKDYEKATMQDVMEELDIAKGTIYHYFKSKEELLEAVIEDIVNQTFEKMAQLLTGTKGNALQKMQKLLEAANMAAKEGEILDHLHRPSNVAMHTKLLVATLIRFAPLFAELIEQGNREKLFKAAHPLECAEFMLFAGQFLTDMGIYPWTKADLTRRAEAFPKLLEQLLQAPAGSFQFLTKRMKTSGYRSTSS